MKIRIVNIGDELLIGQVVNTNASFMSRQLLQQGFLVDRTVVTADRADDIREEIKSAFASVDAVILTGGLGPTKDDITKKVICDYFDDRLVLHQPTLDFVTSWLAGRGVAMSETNRTQAMVPSKSRILPNRCGTAPGIWMEQNGKVLVSLPGVPREMEALMTESVIPALRERFMLGEHYLCKVVQTLGIGESTLSDLLEPWELSLPPHIGLAYLPANGIIRLRLTGSGPDAEVLEKEMDAEVEKLCQLAEPYVFTRRDEPMHQLVGRLLKEQSLTVGTAESCTGGNVAHLLTSEAGSSAFFKGSVVSYSNSVKMNVLGVNSKDLEQYGAVSQAVVEQMALGARQLLEVDYALATSGIAGPDGGTDEKPVGTVWMALAGPDGVKSQCVHFGNAGGRSRVIERATIRVLDMLRQELAPKA